MRSSAADRALPNESSHAYGKDADDPNRNCGHCDERALMAPLGASVPQRYSSTLNLNVLLIGGATTAAWQSALSSEGVAYTLVIQWCVRSETMTLPTLSMAPPRISTVSCSLIHPSPSRRAANDARRFRIAVPDSSGRWLRIPSTLLGETEVSSDRSPARPAR